MKDCPIGEPPNGVCLLSIFGLSVASAIFFGQLVSHVEDFVLVIFGRDLAPFPCSVGQVHGPFDIRPPHILDSAPSVISDKWMRA